MLFNVEFFKYYLITIISLFLRDYEKPILLRQNCFEGLPTEYASVKGTYDLNPSIFGIKSSVNTSNESN